MRRSYGVSAIAVGLMFLGSQAMSMAPVISDLPSPVVGNETAASPPNAFVYPDAFNLDSYVSDDTTSDGAIIWSFEDAGNRYQINGVDSLGGGNPNSPGAFSIATQDLDNASTETPPNFHTITIRDKSLSPLAGPNTDPGTPGILNPSGEIVTLIASDGTTYTMKDMLVYTDDQGQDRLSGGPTPTVVVPEINFLTAAPTTDWIYSNGIAGSAVSSKNAGQGLCIQVPLSNVSLTEWISPYGLLPLTQNAVWRIRAQVNAGTLAANTTPLWSIVVDNFSNDSPPTVSENKYGEEALFLDNVGGANSAGGALKNYEVWVTPIAISAADWNDVTNGMFTSAKDPINDARVHFRVTDVDGAGYGGESDAGKVCLEKFAVDSFDIDTIPATSTEYDAETLSATTHNVSTIFAGSTNIAFAGGNATLTPSSATAWNLEIVSYNPGTGTLDPLGNPSSTPAFFPIVDSTDGLYKFTMGAQAPNATGENNPPDGISIGMDDASTEVLLVSNVLASTNLLGMPKASAPTVYTVLYDSHQVTASGVANIDRIRPRLDLLFSPAVGVGSPGSNQGGITIDYMKVEKLARPVQ